MGSFSGSNPPTLAGLGEPDDARGKESPRQRSRGGPRATTCSLSSCWTDFLQVTGVFFIQYLAGGGGGGGGGVGGGVGPRPADARSQRPSAPGQGAGSLSNEPLGAAAAAATTSVRSAPRIHRGNRARALAHRDRPESNPARLRAEMDMDDSWEHHVAPLFIGCTQDAEDDQHGDFLHPDQVGALLPPTLSHSSLLEKFARD